MFQHELSAQGYPVTLKAPTFPVMDIADNRIFVVEPTRTGAYLSPLSVALNSSHGV